MPCNRLKILLGQLHIQAKIKRCNLNSRKRMTLIFAL
nr:MAG TPA: hypothetical protein [Caudoviricetes sp.]